jgi:hypothetical protein
LLTIAVPVILAFVGLVPVRADVTRVTLADPGTYGEDDDYFTRVWGNPRDMSDTQDLYLLYSSCGNNPARAKWAETGFANGIWHGVTSDVGETRYVFMLNPGWVSSLDTGEDGELRPIDTRRYRQLSFRMRVANGQGTYYPAVEWADVPIGGGAPRGRKNFQVQSDGRWHIYTFDLGSDSAWTSGPVSSLWIQFASLSAGHLVEIDWIRLTPAQSRRITWQGDGLSGAASVYLGPDPSHPESYGDLLIFDGRTPRQIDATNRALDIPASLPGGTYYVRVKAGATGATSAQSWSFLPMPIAQIVAPSATSGEEFAASVVGNPWDMNGMDDVDMDSTKTGNIKSLRASGGVLNIVTQDDGLGSCAAPWPHRPLGLNLGGHTIDTNKFKYITYRYKVDDAPDQGAGGVHRVRWQARQIPNWPTGRTDDISLYDGEWNTYRLDLSSVALEAELGGWGDFPVDVLQIMIHESHREWTSHLDWVKLTADNVGTNAYAAQWNVLNTNAPLTTTLYWAEKRDSAYRLVPGTEHVIPPPGPIGDPSPHQVYLPLVLSAPDPGGAAQFRHTMSMAGLARGEYYLAIKLEDGYSVSWWYSELPVVKQ